MTLDRLMSPRSIAVIGGRECERVIEQCDRMGFDGTIWPVHPKREQMGRRACFASLADLPSAPDAAYIAVNRERTIDVVRGLNDAGCGGAICYASGWAEAEDEGAIGLQEKLVEFEVLELLGLRGVFDLRIDKLELVAGQLCQRRVALRADA